MIDEVNAEGVTVEVMLKEPYSTDPITGEVTPMVAHMGWSAVPVVADHDDCEHTETVCDQCADSWAIDHHLRILQHGVPVYYSEGAPID